MLYHDRYHWGRPMPPDYFTGGQIITAPYKGKPHHNKDHKLDTQAYQDTGCDKNPKCLTCPFPVDECPLFQEDDDE